MIYIIDNFLKPDDCDYLIELHKKNPTYFYESNKTYTLCVKDLGKSLTGNKDKIIEETTDRILDLANRYKPCKLFNSEIVHWPKDSFMDFHLDPPTDKFSCVIYLNNDYKGGETIIKDIEIKPQKGKLVIFSNSEYLHCVSKITENDRYTFSFWLN